MTSTLLLLSLTPTRTLNLFCQYSIDLILSHQNVESKHHHKVKSSLKRVHFLVVCLPIYDSVFVVSCLISKNEPKLF